MAGIPFVYLDSQDFSKFGDVLRGKADASFERTFAELESRRAAGTVRFVISMPVLGELLQYTPDFRETTYKKAEAVELLCGGWAVAFPGRVIAAEIGELAASSGVNTSAVYTQLISGDWNWYPDISESFKSLESQLRDGIEERVAQLPTNRRMRRGVKKMTRPSRIRQIAREAVPAMAAQYELPESVIARSVVAVLEGRVTAERAGRELFGAIARPSKFVETYFERIETDRSLPRWMGEMGRALQSAFERLRETVRPLLEHEVARDHLRETLRAHEQKLGATILDLAAEDLAAVGVPAAVFEAIRTSPSLAWSVPASRLAGSIVGRYVEQVLGYAGPEAKVEGSFGGDLIHALYLPHVDLWRADRRFAALVKGAVPEFAGRIVSSVHDLPAAIDAFRD